MRTGARKSPAKMQHHSISEGMALEVIPKRVFILSWVPFLPPSSPLF